MVQIVGALAQHHASAILAVSGLGLLLGMRHSTDADHVVALSTIVSQQRSLWKAAMIGALWGVGHTITIVAMGALIILFHVSLPARLGLALEFCVGVMLVVLGILSLTGAMHRWAHRFTPRLMQPVESHDGKASGPWRSDLQHLGRFQLLRPIAIGLVHGLAGSAAVALLVMGTIPNPRWATAYLFIFGAGTVVGMMLITIAMAASLSLGRKRFARWNEYLANVSGLASVCFGTFLIYQLGFVDGLFRHTPHWVPR